MFQKLLHHPSEWRDAGTGGHEEVVMPIPIDRQNEAFACGTRYLNLVPDAQITEIVAADAEEETVFIRFIGIVLADEPFACRRYDRAVSILPPGGRGDRVQPDGMRSSPGLLTGWDDSERLSGMKAAGKRRT